MPKGSVGRWALCPSSPPPLSPGPSLPTAVSLGVSRKWEGTSRIVGGISVCPCWLGPLSAPGLPASMSCDTPISTPVKLPAFKRVVPALRLVLD